MIYRRNRSDDGAPAAMNGGTVRQDAGRVERPTAGRTEGASAIGVRAAPPKAEAERRVRNPRPSVATDAGRYLRANVILPELREKYLKRRITWQQYKTLRGQALAGDIDGAVNGLARIMRTQEREDEQ